MRKYRMCIISFVLGALIFGSVGVIASNTSIDVSFDISDIKINGVSSMPSQKPFIYNGTTYVPLRYIGEKLGYEIDWNSETRTVLIGEEGLEGQLYPGNNIEPIYTNIPKLSTSKITPVYLGSALSTNTNESYNSYISFTSRGAYSFYETISTEYLLDYGYDVFNATLGLTDTFKNTKATEILFRIYADDKMVYSKSLKPGDVPENIHVDISKTSKVKFELYAKNDYVEVALFNPVFK